MKDPNAYAHRVKAWVVLGLLLLVALPQAGCTRSAVVLPTTTPIPTLTEAESIATEIVEGELPVDPNPDDQAVVWVAAGSSLVLREEPGLTGTEITTIGSTQQGLVLTGQQTNLGSSGWVQVKIPSGLSGWVAEWNLTEQVPAEVFCADPRVGLLLAQLRAAVSDRSGDQLLQILSPKRGLIIRHDPWNPEVRIPPAGVRAAFDDLSSIMWGMRYASQTEIRGSLSEVISPELEEVLAHEPLLSCNEVVVGSGAPASLWPHEYSNLNFVSLHRAPPDDGNPFNWRTWIVGVEYVKGQPFVAVLLQVRPQA